MAWLTKSRFLSGLQCHKRLWFEVHQPLEEDVDPPSSVLQGRSFDEAVRRLHPGILISRDAGMPAAIAATEALLTGALPAPDLIYQPAFKAGDLAVIVDVLRRAESGFDLIEVKATTAMKESHIPDAAFQALVLKRAGISVRRMFIGHVNNQFTLTREGHYEGLLFEADVTEAVEAYLPAATREATAYENVMKLAAAPDRAVGDHCNIPYDCPFIERCHAYAPPRPTYHVDLLPRGGGVVKALLEEGYADLKNVPASRLTNAMHLRVLDATVTGRAYFDPLATTALRQLKRPFSYLDFETINMAVPEVIGTHPYEQVPFQWSVHIESAEGATKHAEFLAIERFGDFEAMARGLIDSIPAEGTVFAYNANFEHGVLDRLADLAPQHAAKLRDIAARLFDLLPVTRSAYYHRDMQGSWSIKNVMPTIDASLDYTLKGEVQDGGAAQIAFLALKNPTIELERAAELRAALLDYCRHDTWVMVVLRRFLSGEPVGLSQ